MRAIVIKQFGGPEQLVIQELPDPEPAPGHVVIEVKAFGINHAETHMRKGEWAEAAKVSGIECVGLVNACPDGQFAAGQKVAALMGGMGRTINGSYAEFTRVPTSNVAQIDSDLPWEELAAIPESYATAWTCLYGNLALDAGQTLVIRGATSALGQAALNIAANAGARVIATTRNPDRISKLESLGAQHVELEGPQLSRHIRESHPEGIHAVLDLIGNSTILDSLAMVRRGGRVCLAGFLGGLAPLASTHFRQYHSRRLSTGQQAATTPNHLACFGLKRSRKLIGLWSRIRPMGSWSCDCKEHKKYSLYRITETGQYRLQQNEGRLLKVKWHAWTSTVRDKSLALGG